MITPDWDSLYKKNPAFYVVSDAQQLFNLAQRAAHSEHRMEEQIFSRTSILLFPLALEAVINFVYEYYGVYEKDDLKRIPVKEKWINASLKCLPQVGVLERDGEVVYRRGDRIETFSEDSETFRRYLELKDIRNDIVHLKPDFGLIKLTNVHEHENNLGFYPYTAIPKDISKWEFEHTAIAKLIFDDMIRHLNRFMKGEIEWLLSHPAFIEIIV